MKHLFLQGSIDDFMVFYPPKKKVLLYETILEAKQNYKYNGEMTLLPTIIKELQTKGFKCVKITDELHEKINVYDDITDTSFCYRGILVSQSQYSGWWFRVGNTYNTCFTIREAIETIDKELK